MFRFITQVKIQPVARYDWEQKYYYGNLIAVSNAYLAYAIRGEWDICLSVFSTGWWSGWWVYSCCQCFRSMDWCFPCPPDRCQQWLCYGAGLECQHRGADPAERLHRWRSRPCFCPPQLQPAGLPGWSRQFLRLVHGHGEWKNPVSSFSD